MIVKIILVIVITLLIVSMLKSLLSGRQKNAQRYNNISNKKNNQKWPFYPSYTMSEVELKLYWRLVNILPEYIILAQVQASRVLKVQQGANQQYWFNRICRMSYDFVVCCDNSYPLVVIELDDKTHDRPDRQEVDARKDKSLHDANLPIIRWRVNQVPVDNVIRKQIITLHKELIKHTKNRKVNN